MGNQLHTSGPWRVEWIRNSTYIKAENTDRDISICRVMTHRNSNNVALLVNAPKLLSALEEIIEIRHMYNISGKQRLSRLEQEIDAAMEIVMDALGVTK